MESPIFSTALILILTLTLIIVAVPATVEAGKGEPPSLHENVQTKFRIPVGTKTFKLTCPVKEAETGEDGPAADPTTIIRWQKDGEELSDWDSSRYRFLNSNHDLRIRSPQPLDGGSFKCTAINGFGRREMEFEVEVYDPDQVEALNPSESLLLSELPSSPVWQDRDAMDRAIKAPLRLGVGSTLFLKCPARGSPLPTISWLFNGHPIKRELSTPTSATFTIHSLSAMDGGVYSCRLENTYGSLEADFQVEVAEEGEGTVGSFGASGVVAGPTPPAPTINQPFNTSVRRGHIAQFQCRVQWRKERPMIRWLRRVEPSTPPDDSTTPTNGTLLHINGMHLLVLEQQGGEAVQVEETPASKAYVNQLVIRNVQMSDRGHYYCVVSASSAGQFVYRSAYLEVVDIPSSPMSGIKMMVVAVMAVVLTLVVAAVAWLCCSGGGGGGGGSGGGSGRSGKIGQGVPFSASSKSNSSSSTSSSVDPTKSQMNSTTNYSTQLPPPPPPKIPLPMVPLPLPPPSRPFLPTGAGGGARSCHGTPQLQHRHHQLQQHQAHFQPYFAVATMDSRRYPHPPPPPTQRRPSPQQMLHRTARAPPTVNDNEEETGSRMSSNIYASGSPLPPYNTATASPQPHRVHQQPQQQRISRHLFPMAPPPPPQNWMNSLPQSHFYCPPPEVQDKFQRYALNRISDANQKLMGRKGD